MDKESSDLLKIEIDKRMQKLNDKLKKQELELGLSNVREIIEKEIFEKLTKGTEQNKYIHISQIGKYFHDLCEYKRCEQIYSGF